MKLNNKGFAISTVIYGLSIMGILLVAIVMATMASTRSNSRQLAKSIEEELNRFSKTETFFQASNSGSFPKEQEYVVPTGGWYKIELWGSKGGSGSNGAYTSGIIKLKEGEKLYFFVGENGRESDVRIVGGDYNDSYSASTRIMVAAGGGTGNNAPGGTLYGYNSKMKPKGGYINSQITKDYGLAEVNNSNPTNGTLIGLPKDYSVSDFTQPGVSTSVSPSATTHNGASGGGDGYYPSNNQNIGGISYIAGYAGSLSIEKGKVKKDPIASIYEQVYDVEADTGNISYGAKKGDFYFVDGIMIGDLNTGKGKAKIERLISDSEAGQVLNKKNDTFNKNISSVKDCVETTDNNVVKNISVITEGKEFVSSIATPVKTGNMVCTTANLKSSTRSIDEIAVWHTSGIDYKNETIEVFDVDSNSWIKIKDKSSQTDISETETVTGIRISAYQFDSTKDLPDRGNYYIMPVLSNNKVISAAKVEEEDAQILKIEGINGYKRQKWSIEKIEGTNYYKIYELARYKAMSIVQDENIIGNGICADTTFNKYNEDTTQYWIITPMNNGTYTITTKVEPFESGTGNISAQTNGDVSRNYNAIEIAKNNNQTTRFKIISADYSSN